MASLKLKAENLTCERGTRRVFEDISFTLHAGQALIVTGANGAGKSTLLRVLAGFLPLISGKLILEGAEDDAVLSEHAHYLGHQNAIKPQLSVQENLSFWRDVSVGTARPLHQALDQVGLLDLASIPAQFLSAGQRRRLAIARLLVLERPIWLLDEPATALDAASEATLATLMKAHLAQGGLLIAATHTPLGLETSLTLNMLA